MKKTKKIREEFMMNLKHFLKPELIWTKSKLETQLEVFELISEKAKTKKYITENFLEKIKKRESEFPTGLQLDGYGVAIPHTDPECINEQFIAVLTSKDGIPFKRMDDPSQTSFANIVFMLGLNEPHSQLEVLQQLMSILQNKETVEQLISFENKDDIVEYLKNISDIKNKIN